MKPRPNDLIYGIDPGTSQSALIVWSDDKMSYIYENNAKIKNLVSSFRSGWLFIEMMNYQGRFGIGKETFKTCVEIGRFYEASRVPVTLITRNDVKLYWCQSVRAKDGDVTQVLKDRIGDKGTAKNPGPTYRVASHGWQALAVAAMGMELLYSNRLKLEQSNIRQYDGRKES